MPSPRAFLLSGVTHCWHVGHPGSIPPSLTHSAHQSDWRHWYLLRKPIYIWMNGGGEARPDQCTDIDTRSHARSRHSWTHSLSKIRNWDELLSKVCVRVTLWVCGRQKRHCNSLADRRERRERRYRHRLPPQRSVMVWEEHVNNKYLPLQRGGLLQLPVQQDTRWQPDPPQIALMLSNWGLKHTHGGPRAQLCVNTCMQMQPWIWGGGLMPSDDWLRGAGCFKDPPPLTFFKTEASWRPGVL